MSEPKSIEEVPSWVIVNALRCPIEAQISIVAKLLQHLDREQRTQALSMSGVIKSVCECIERESTYRDGQMKEICWHCDKPVEQTVL
jgi:hypothetical protein